MSLSLRDIDTSLVKCPNNCFLSAGLGKTKHVPRQFLWVGDGGVGTRKYCERCGSELVESDKQ